MIPIIEQIRGVIRTYRLRQRFPQSSIYYGAVADWESRLGAHVVLFGGVKLTASRVGAYCYIQSDSIVNHSEIGPFSSIAGGVIIGLGDHPLTMVSTNPIFYDPEQPLPKFFVTERLFTDIFPKTVIGADVWIGQRAMIKAGVQIGVGAVIGAASMVTRDVPPYTIAAGNPCRPIKLRFSENVCARLIESQWWTYQEAELLEVAPLFSNPEAFLAAIANRRA